MSKYIIVIFVIATLGIISFGFADTDSPSGEENYKKYCATCHGAKLQGGLSKSLADGEWQFGNKTSDIIDNIKNGIPKNGMPSFAAILSDSDINDLVSFINEQEKNRKQAQEKAPEKKLEKPQYKTLSVVETFDYNVKVELITDDVEEPWAIAFISESKVLITEKPGNLRIIENGKLRSEPVKGIPDVLYAGQGGLLDVAVDPDYESNGWIYMSYSHELKGKGMTKLVRGKINNNTWTNEEKLFEAPEELYIDTRHHFGSRIVFDNDGHLYFSIGDRGKRHMAQDLSRPNGKIHRIFKDGRIPEDNPFVSDKNVVPSIFAYGNRNAQGLSINPQTGELWESEHGQKGGDELNIIRPGNNYGWDIVTYGRNYDGTVSSEQVKMPGVEIPIIFWRPSIAVCGIDFYQGSLFKKWDNHLIVGALKYEEVRILDIEDNRVIHQEVILKDNGRVRDVSTAPDGSIYVVVNEPDKILRLTPEN